MTLTLPPGAVLLSVKGVRDPTDQAAALAAIRARDPAAHVRPDWARGLIIVQSDHPPEALRLAVQDAGFITAWLAYPPHETSARGVAAAILRVMGFGFAGCVLGALVGGVAATALIALDPGCGRPGDSGGCAMGIPAFAVGAGFIGGAAGMAWALIRSIRGR